MNPVGFLGPKGVRDAMRASTDAQRAEGDRLRASWKMRIAKAKPAEMAAVVAQVEAEKSAHTASCQRQAHVRAAMITSAPGWEHPADKLDKKPARNAEQRDGRAASRILIDAYRLVGVRARALAAMKGEEFSERHVLAVKLTKADVEQLATQAGMHGAGATKRAWKLLDKHIRPDMMDADAAKFFTMQFLDFQAQVIIELGDAEERIQRDQNKNNVQLAEKRERIENFARDGKEHKKRIQRVQWTGETVSQKRDASKGATDSELRVVAGRLVKVEKN